MFYCDRDHGPYVLVHIPPAKPYHVAKVCSVETCKSLLIKQIQTPLQMAFRFFIRSGVVYPVYKVDTIATAVPRERAVLLSPAEGQLL